VCDFETPQGEETLMKKMKFLVIAAVFAIAAFSCSTTKTAETVSRDPASKCGAEAFVKRIRSKGCYLSNNDERRIVHNAAYCKQLANRFQIVTMERSGDVVILDTNDCTRTKFDVDASGIDDLKIIQDYAYMTSGDGQLYIFSSHSSKFYELRSNNGNSYSRANNSNVIDLTGGQGGGVVYTRHANGTTQEWDSDKINAMDAKRLRALRFYTFGSNGSVYND